MTFAEKVKYTRNKLLITQRELAKEIDVGYVSIARWETGKVIPVISYQRKFFEFCKKRNIIFDD